MRSIFVYRQNGLYRKMELANTMAQLTKGLLGRTTAGNGLFLMGATSIHTFEMKFPIDVVYLNTQGYVIGLEQSLMPYKNGKYVEGTGHILEFNTQTIQRDQIAVGELWYWTFEK